MTLGAGEVAAVTWGVIGCGGDAGCRRLQPVLSPDRERAGYGLPSGSAVPELEAPREGARQDGKGRMPGVVRGPLYVRQKFFEPPVLFRRLAKPPFYGYGAYRGRNQEWNTVNRMGGGSMDSALPPHEGSPLNSSGLSFFWLSHHPRYFSGIRSGTRRRSARWGISSPPYPFGMRHTVAHLFRP